MPSYIRVGQVRGAHGVKGAVKVLPLTDNPARFQAGAEMWLAGAPHRIEWVRPGPVELIVKLAGVDQREGAAALLSSYLEVPEAEAASLPEGAWYHHQLLGLQVRSEAGAQLGEIADVLERPANDVWVVRGRGREVLVPATKDAVLAVDLAAREVVVANWLLEVEEA